MVEQVVGTEDRLLDPQPGNRSHRRDVHLKRSLEWWRIVHQTLKGAFILNRIGILVLLALLALAATAFPQETTQTASQAIAAIVNGEVITKDTLNAASQLSQIIQSLFSSHYLFVEILFTTDEGKSFIDRYQRTVLDQLIDNRLLVQQAKALAIPVDETKIDQQVTEKLNQIMQQNQLTLEQIDSILKQRGSSLDEYKANLANSVREQLLVAGLHDFITRNAAVTEDDIAAYYNDHQDDYTDDDGNVQPLSEVHDKIRDSLLSEAKSKVWNDWFDKMKAEAKIEIKL